MLVVILADVPLGANKPNQLTESYWGEPASAVVGTSGSTRRAPDALRGDDAQGAGPVMRQCSDDAGDREIKASGDQVLHNGSSAAVANDDEVRHSRLGGKPLASQATDVLTSANGAWLA
jgi:hypothetical protein